MIRFGQDVCANPVEATNREWLETNGIGGFASSTIIGMNTRRYHGLLVASTRPPVGRLVLLSKLEEVAWIGEEQFELSTNQYPGVIFPAGYRHLIGFRLDPFPVFTYEVNGSKLEKTVFLVHGENTVVIKYHLVAGGQATRLDVRPLTAFRDCHGTTHENHALNPFVANEAGAAMVSPYVGLPPLWFAHNGHVDPNGCWYRTFVYELERERGLDFVEDLFSPMSISFDIAPGRDGVIIASTEHLDANGAGEYEKAERRRRAAIAANENHPLASQFVAAADQFIVNRGDEKTIVAGYHWFGDWGRDTMIALPGLTLATGRPEVARSVLLGFARHVNQGMLPNRFPEAGEEPEYNTVDATLWYFEAIRKYVDYTGDLELARDLFPVLTGIMQWHFRGTRHGIRSDKDGLLSCGEPGVQLTWMDAKIGDWVVTPRHGKPVEIQALWHNALRTMERLAAELGHRKEEVEEYAERASLAADSFNQQFWNEAAGCLYDVVNGDEHDPSIRPNQIFAISLPHELVLPKRAESIVEVVERELLTPWGLRTLARSDPRYCPAYGGDARTRDTAYHQGTVWPWLIGPFITAYVKVHERSSEALVKARSWLEHFEAHLHHAGLGQVSEVFSADAPHAAGGCIAQAWSVAEILRALKEDVASPATAEPSTTRAARAPKAA